MATKSGQPEPEKAEVVEELLEALDASLDRVKVLYEQYFLGIQKQPPTYLHTEVERKIRDIVQLQIRNTALRYRFATLQQKFGSYNAYWRRTLRQIENGTYTRNLSKIGRHAAKTGAAVPEEILAAMPKRMRDQITRDREAALALAALRNHHADDPEFLTLVDDGEDLDLGLEDQGSPAFVRESAELRRSVVAAGGTHKIDESDADFDLDAFFAKVMSESDPSPILPARESPTGSAPVAQPRALLDGPAIRWRTPVPKVEPRPALESRSGAQVPGHPGPAPGSEPPSTGQRNIEPPSIGQPAAGRSITFKPNAAPPTVRLRSPSFGRPITANPSSEGPITERMITKRPITEPPSAGPPSSGAGQPSGEPLSARPPGAAQPSTVRSSTGPLNTAPTVRLGRPGFGRPITEPPVAAPSSAALPSAAPQSAAPPSAAPSSAAYPSAASSSAAYPNAAYPNAAYPNAAYPNAAYPNAGYPGVVPPSAVLPSTVPPGAGPLSVAPPSALPPSAASPSAASPSAASPSAASPSAALGAAPLGAAPLGAAPLGALPLTGRTASTAPPTVRLRSPGAGRMNTVRGIEPPSPDEQQQQPAEPPSPAKPSGEPPRPGDGLPPSGPPSTGTGQPPGPPIGIRPIAPSVFPPIRGTSTPVSSRPLSPLPSQLVKPNPPKPPALAPSQATRPLPIVPGAAAALAPSTAETLAGPFPRIPSPPTFPSKPRAANEAPVTEERLASTERQAPAQAPAQAPDRAAPSRPAPNKP